MTVRYLRIIKNLFEIGEKSKINIILLTKIDDKLDNFHSYENENCILKKIGISFLRKFPTLFMSG